jgi:hypothetical protein
MEIFWLLFAMPVLGLLYTACVIVHDGRCAPETGAHPLRSQSLDSTAGMAWDVGSYREVKQITARELKCLVYKPEDLILVDLRPRSETSPISFPVANVLFASPSDLVNLLYWLPPATSAVLYGGTATCAQAIQVGHGISGTAPIYVLSEAPIYSMVAQETSEAKLESGSAPRSEMQSKSFDIYSRLAAFEAEKGDFQ